MTPDPHNPRKHSEWPTQWAHAARRTKKVRRHIVNVHPSLSAYCSCGWNGLPQPSRVAAWLDANEHQAGPK